MNEQHRSYTDPFTQKLLSYVETGYRVALTLTADTRAARDLARDAMTSLWMRRVELEPCPDRIKTELLASVRDFYQRKYRAGSSPACFAFDASGDWHLSTAREMPRSAAEGFARLTAR